MAVTTDETNKALTMLLFLLFISYSTKFLYKFVQEHFLLVLYAFGTEKVIYISNGKILNTYEKWINY